MNIDQSFGNSLSHVAVLYAKKLNIKVTGESLKNTLEQNPYYPSLYSLGNAFDRFGIANQSFKIPASEFHQLEAPFLTYISHEGTTSDFVLVTEISDRKMKYVTGSNKSYTVSKEQFLKNYREVVFAAEGSETSGESDYENKLKKEKRVAAKSKMVKTGALLTLSLLIASFFYSFIQAGTSVSIWSTILVTVAKLTGLSASILLLLYEIDSGNSVTKSICTAGKKTSCDAVLSSKASKVLGMSWSEIGFFYFASTMLFLLVPGISMNSKIPLLAMSGTLVSLFIPYSLYYQWRVAKQWCPLCLMVQGAIALELIWSINGFWLNDGTFLNTQLVSTILILSTCLLLPFIIWNLLKPIFLLAKESPTHLAGYKRLLYNPDMFNALLQQQSSAADGWQNLGITIGNPDARHTILKVCNPYCGPCAKAHPVLEEIIAHNRNYNVKVIFTSTNSAEDRGSAVVRHLMAVAAKGDEKTTASALDQWYMAREKDYPAFSTKYPMNGELKNQDAKLEAMSEWCKLAEIAYTPTIFIDGKRLPETYSIEELKNIL